MKLFGGCVKFELEERWPVPPPDPSPGSEPKSRAKAPGFVTPWRGPGCPPAPGHPQGRGHGDLHRDKAGTALSPCPGASPSAADTGTFALPGPAVTSRSPHLPPPITPQPGPPRALHLRGASAVAAPRASLPPGPRQPHSREAFGAQHGPGPARPRRREGKKNPSGKMATGGGRSGDRGGWRGGIPFTAGPWREGSGGAGPQLGAYLGGGGGTRCGARRAGPGRVTPPRPARRCRPPPPAAGRAVRGSPARPHPRRHRAPLPRSHPPLTAAHARSPDRPARPGPPRAPPPPPPLPAPPISRGSDDGAGTGTGSGRGREVSREGRRERAADGAEEWDEDEREVLDSPAPPVGFVQTFGEQLGHGLLEVQKLWNNAR
ncbi:basic proline-rich protein-like [Calypte anna]|uniref:basic proline-rich protein-like n=1 Tax=Calypte anna TaxID=9244 RepID=UPI0011C4A772|nr:basic proline-rich protein-like [Calypte anna]